jgi:hypothetical protein
MTTKTAELKLVFAPGCFDEFEGTQDELTALMKEIQDLFDSGELLTKSVSVEDFIADESDFDDIADLIMSGESNRVLH